MPDLGRRGLGLYETTAPSSRWTFGEWGLGGRLRFTGKANWQRLGENVESRRGEMRGLTRPKMSAKRAVAVRAQCRSVLHSQSNSPWQWSHVLLPLNCVTATCGQETHIFIHEATLGSTHTATYCFNIVAVITRTGANLRFSRLPTFFSEMIRYLLHAGGVFLSTMWNYKQSCFFVFLFFYF